jgi:hypothetical protein
MVCGVQVEALAVAKFNGPEQLKAEQSKRAAKKAARLEKKVQTLTTQAALHATSSSNPTTGNSGGELAGAALHAHMQALALCE